MDERGMVRWGVGRDTHACTRRHTHTYYRRRVGRERETNKQTDRLTNRDIHIYCIGDASG